MPANSLRIVREVVANVHVPPFTIGEKRLRDNMSIPNYMRFTRYTTLFFIINLKLLIWSDDPVLLNLRLGVGSRFSLFLSWHFYSYVSYCIYVRIYSEWRDTQ